MFSAGENLFLEQALRSLPGVQTFRGNAENRGLPGDAFDLYVFDNWLPNNLPAGDMLLVNPPNSTPLFAMGTQLPPTDDIVTTDEESAIASFVDLDEMSLLQYRRHRRRLGADAVPNRGGRRSAGGGGERAPDRDSALRPARFQLAPSNRLARADGEPHGLVLARRYRLAARGLERRRCG